MMADVLKVVLGSCVRGAAAAGDMVFSDAHVVVGWSPHGVRAAVDAGSLLHLQYSAGKFPSHSFFSQLKLFVYKMLRSCSEAMVT